MNLKLTINNTIDFFIKDRFYIGTSLLRIILGCLILYNYLIHFSQRYVLFSDFGITNISESYLVNTLSLYNLNSSLFYFDIIYILGIIVALLFTIGYKGRISTILNYIFYASFYFRMSYLGDGGDNLIYIILFFLIFSNNTRYFSLDNYLNKNNKSLFKNDFLQKTSNIFQNFVVIFSTAQICIIYFTSAFYQIMGETWSNGTAIYYVSQVKTLAMPYFSEMVNNHIYLFVVLTYASIIVKLAFPFLILNPKTKLISVISVFLFHAGIAFGMGLYSFSIAMVAIELLLFTDKEYIKLRINISNISDNSIKFIKSKMLLFGKTKLSNFKLIVFYDSWCPFCQKTKKRIKKFDFFDLIEFKSFRDLQIQKEFNLDVEKVSLRMHSTSKNKKLVSGIDSFIDISKRLVMLWPFLPILTISKYIGLGNRIYDYIASKRTVIPVNQCETSCSLPKLGGE